MPGRGVFTASVALEPYKDYSTASSQPFTENIGHETNSPPKPPRKIPVELSHPRLGEEIRHGGASPTSHVSHLLCVTDSYYYAR